MVGQRDGEDGDADRHGQLRDPDRGGILALGYVVELVRPVRPLDGVEGEIGRRRGADAEAPEFAEAAPFAHLRQQQGHPDMGAVVQRVGHGEERRRRHAVAGIIGRAGEGISRPPRQHLQDDDRQQQKQKPRGNATAQGVDEIQYRPDPAPYFNHDRRSLQRSSLARTHDRAIPAKPGRARQSRGLFHLRSTWSP